MPAYAAPESPAAPVEASDAGRAARRPKAEDGERMTEDEFENVLKTLIQDASNYQELELSPIRARATDYYHGAPLGNEEEGRSQVVLTPVRDAILGVLPSVLRVFFGSDRVVEFTPTTRMSAQDAKLATDYINYLFSQDNPGFINTMDVLKDGLIRKIGIFKWGYDKTAGVCAYKQQGITREQLEALAADDAVTFTRLEEVVPKQPDRSMLPADIQAGLAANAAALMPPLTYDVEFTREDDAGRFMVWSLPPEEFIFNRNAKSIDTALFVGHRTYKKRGELIAMGISAKDLDAHASGDDQKLIVNPEEVARLDAAMGPKQQSAGTMTDPPAGRANDDIKYVEGYVRVDYDGDGIPELRKVCTIGEGYYPVENIPIKRRPFAIFCPDPEPHVMLGQSWEDRLEDMQRIGSALFRGGLDSLSASIFPRTAYVEGQANVGDIMKTAIGAPMRERAPNMIRAFTVPFVGKEAMPMLDFVNDIVERRTGQNKGVLGLDADALQSMDQAGVQAAIQGSQAQAELLCRIFAETTLKLVFLGLLDLVHEHQQWKRTVEIRGDLIEVDPTGWDPRMSVKVNVGLGSSFVEKKIATLRDLATLQKEVITEFGPTNPLFPIQKYETTIKQILNLQGIQDTQSYMNDIPADWQPPEQAPQPTPEQVLAQATIDVQKLKTQGELAIQKDKLALDARKVELDHEYRMQQLDVELAKTAQTNDTKIATTTQTNETKVKTAEIAADAGDDRAEAELTLAAHDQVHRHTVEKIDAVSKTADVHATEQSERAE